MHKHAYTLLQGMESSWWYHGRTHAVASALVRSGIPKVGSLLDYGAGYGGMAAACREFSQDAYALEPDEEARAGASTRGYRETFPDEATAFSRRYDLIGLFDVLEHLEDDRGFLERAQGALSAEGRIVVTVPAYQWLWSAHDVEHHHFRRYTKGSLTRVFAEMGYEVDYASYWNCALLAPAALLRFAGSSGEAGLTPPSPVNALLRLWLSFEAFLLRFVPLPFGLSIVLVARPKGVAACSSRVFSKLALLLRYGMAGVAGGLAQTLTLFVWVSVLGREETYLAGLAVGFLIALAVSFSLQKYWTFRDGAAKRAPRQLLIYTLVALSGLGLNALLLFLAELGARTIGIDFFEGWYLLAQVISVGVVSVSNFLLNFLITFRHARRERLWEG